ncbi:MAG: elongation factor G [Bacteroidetes bacterium]|nr:elongation factor G [Bacteroidota bacterium]MBU1113890.1 elongation factor G [Bacteroidota bacterium]MBU1798084.1 elongation factor G [Bacteroidota bacterium]
MKVFNPDAIRNIAFIGHGGSGKTLLSEVILYDAGEINRIGSIEEGSTTSDYNKNEIDRRISLSATPLHFEWKDTKINLIDTPGYSDFTGQVSAGLHVADVAISVIKSAEGVEVGTEVTWENVCKHKMPAAILINKVDNEHSKFQETFSRVKERLNNDATIIAYPINEGINFNTVIDIIKMKEIVFDSAESKKFTEKEISDDHKAQAESMREELVEKIAESSEELMNKFFEEGTLNETELKQGLKAAIINRSIIPVFAVSAAKGVGIANFLDFAVNYFPSPVERVGNKAKMSSSDNEIEIKCDLNGEATAFVFKSLSEAHVGELSVLKVFSGKLKAGMDMLNTTRGKSERLGQLFVLNGKNRTEVSELTAGDIGAVVKLKDTHTGNTLASKSFSVVINDIDYPDPTIRAAVVARSKGDEDKISTGLHTFHEENPTVNVHFDPELSQTIISGQGELQLDLAVRMLKSRYNVEVDLVEPKIPYRETIKAVVENAEYKHKKQSGGRGQYGHVVLKLEPLPRGTGIEFVDAIVGGVVPRNFIPAVEKGINEITAKGILTGSKVIDIRATLHFGSYHNVDSDEVSFRLATTGAFKKGFLEAKPILLEPIYNISVKVPEVYMGDVMGDLSSKRGKISGMEAEGPFQVIKAKVPLSELYKYSTHLRSITAGRGVHHREFSHYEEMPKEAQEKVIEEFKKAKEEE